MAVLSKLKKWFTREPESPKGRVSLGPPPALLERYLQYKRLLGANSAILTIVTDLQVKMGEGFLFDMHYVRQSIDNLGHEVEALVKALMGMSGGRYAGLEEARRRVAHLVAEELAGTKMTPVPLALPLAEVREGLFYGGKAEKLGELTRMGLRVPPGFAVSAYAQKLFFETAHMEKFIEQQIARSHVRDLESMREAGEAIKERIMSTALPPELSQAIREHLGRLQAEHLAVRSSALQEDSQFSFAGQFETILNVPRDLVEQRYKEVIASQFTPRSLYYCHTSGFSYQELAMGVVVMEMVPARTAGVLYTDDPRGGEGTIINAVRGLGSLAVGGVVEPDRYRLEDGKIAAQHVGEKTRMHVPAAQGGIQDLATPEELKGACLEEEQVMALAALGQQVKKHFGPPQDIEWALGADGQFYLLQARPLRISRQLKTDYIPPKIKGAALLLEKGIIASRGAAAGPVHLLPHAEALPAVPEGVVLVTSRALPEYGVVVGRVAALVCEAGSATSHLATVLREARVPAVFGAKEASRLLREGDLVTVDAYYGNIYAGRQEELLKAPRGGDAALRETRAYKALARVLKHITPLHLLDPRAAHFRPEACTTYHDITRFAHEKAMNELFHVTSGKLEEGARRLISNLPLDLLVIDLGGGLAPEAAELGEIRPEHLRSRPMRAYWQGVTAVGWRGPRPVDLAGFMSVVLSTATDTNIRERLHEKNFAIITDDYMNLSNRLGFHFAAVESLLGAARDSYVSFSFHGGGAELPRRMRRVRFMAKVLQHLDFRVELQEDSLTARIDDCAPAILEEKLEILGRLMMVTKQLDMTMLSEDLVDQYYQEFLSQGYNLHR